MSSFTLLLTLVLGALVAFTVTSTILHRRGYARALSMPFAAAWALGMLSISLLVPRSYPSGATVIGTAIDSLLISLLLAFALGGATLVVTGLPRRTNPGFVVLGAIAAGIAIMGVGALVVGNLSCILGRGCL